MTKPAKVAFSDIRDVVRWDGTGLRVNPSDEVSDAAAGTIKQVRVRKHAQHSAEWRDGEVRSVEVVLHDKLQAVVFLRPQKVAQRLLHIMRRVRCRRRIDALFLGMDGTEREGYRRGQTQGSDHRGKPCRHLQHLHALVERDRLGCSK